MVRAVDKADAMIADAFQRCIISEVIYHFSTVGGGVPAEKRIFVICCWENAFANNIFGSLFYAL